MKNKYVKNWISLFVVATLTTACGAMKKSNPSGAAASRNLIAKATPTASLPEINLKNIDSTLGTWAAPDTKAFQVIGKIAKTDAIHLIGEPTESYTAIGNLSITRETKTYEKFYTGNEFLPTTQQTDEDHPEIKVYLGQTGVPETPTMILISADDYQSLGNGNTPIFIQYAVQLMCTQWNVANRSFPMNIFNGKCVVEPYTVACQSYGHCSSNCAFADTLNDGHNYGADMLTNTNSPNCIHHEQWPTKAVNLENISTLSEFRIHPIDEVKMQASLVTISGQAMN